MDWAMIVWRRHLQAILKGESDPAQAGLDGEVSARSWKTMVEKAGVETVLSRRSGLVKTSETYAIVLCPSRLGTWRASEACRPAGQ
jgi:hypothetical protein